MCVIKNNDSGIVIKREFVKKNLLFNIETGEKNKRYGVIMGIDNNNAINSKILCNIICSIQKDIYLF